MSKKQSHAVSALDAAKLESPDADTAPAIKAPEEVAPEAAELKAEKKAVAVAKIAVVKPPVYKVLRKCTVSWQSQMITLNEGELVHLVHYGAEGIERLKDSGVALELVAD